MEYLIVTPDPVEQEWIRTAYPQLAGVPTIDEPSTYDVAGKIIIGGSLPPRVAYAAHAVWTIEYDTGIWLAGNFETLAEMIASGAHLVAYHFSHQWPITQQMIAENPPTGADTVYAEDAPQ
jgi:hypothetical protein